MSDHIPVLVISEEEHTRLAELARQRGYNAPDDYLRALVDADAEQHQAPLPFGDDDIRTKLKRALRDVRRGDVLTEDEFWKAVADDE